MHNCTFGSALSLPGDAGHTGGRASAPSAAALWLFPWVEVMAGAGSRVGSCHVHPPRSSSTGTSAPSLVPAPRPRKENLFVILLLAWDSVMMFCFRATGEAGGELGEP